MVLQNRVRKYNENEPFLRKHCILSIGFVFDMRSVCGRHGDYMREMIGKSANLLVIRSKRIEVHADGRTHSWLVTPCFFPESSGEEALPKGVWMLIFTQFVPRF